MIKIGVVNVTHLVSLLSNTLFWRHTYFDVKKARTCLFSHLSAIVHFSKQLQQDMPDKAENWHALSHRLYFLTHCFYISNICLVLAKIYWRIQRWKRMYLFHKHPFYSSIVPWQYSCPSLCILFFYVVPGFAVY